MTYRGRIENGLVVFNEEVNLPDGIEVTVLVPQVVTSNDEAAAGPTLLETLTDFVGSAKNLPSDASVNVDHYLYGLPKK